MTLSCCKVGIGDRIGLRLSSKSTARVNVTAYTSRPWLLASLLSDELGHSIKDGVSTCAQHVAPSSSYCPMSIQDTVSQESHPEDDLPWQEIAENHGYVVVFQRVIDEIIMVNNGFPEQLLEVANSVSATSSRIDVIMIRLMLNLLV